MASSRAEPPADPEFALQELTACWDQGYEALLRGDLDRVATLMVLADEHLARLGRASPTTTALDELRRLADAARGRLEHGMRAGLEALQKELRHARDGARALSGYRDHTRGVGERVLRDA